jgi:hypothetical protein
MKQKIIGVKIITDERLAVLISRPQVLSKNPKAPAKGWCRSVGLLQILK